MQKRKGPFEGFLVLQTLAKYYTSLTGSQTVHALGPSKNPKGALVLSATAVSVH